LYDVKVEPGVPPNAGLFLSDHNLWSYNVAKVISKKRSSRLKSLSEGNIPFTRTNYTIMGVGLAVIVAGYLAMWGQPIEGALPLVVSPLLLIIGYCVIVPLGILYRKSAGTEASAHKVEGAA
jgi:hypothetical protein